MTLYNLFPLLAGPFSRWGEHFTRAAAMGFDWVFVNPIQQPGASRSLYSIADYFRFNPALLDPQSAAPPEEPPFCLARLVFQGPRGFPYRA